MDSPYEIGRAPDELHYTYLDTFGRPVIVAYKKNLVEQHIQDIVVSGSTALLCACLPEDGCWKPKPWPSFPFWAGVV